MEHATKACQRVAGRTFVVTGDDRPARLINHRAVAMRERDDVWLARADDRQVLVFDENINFGVEPALQYSDPVTALRRRHGLLESSATEVVRSAISVAIIQADFPGVASPRGF